MAKLVRIALGLFFAVAGTLKLAAPQRFADTIGEFGIVLESVLLPTAIAIAAIEVCIGVGMLARKRIATWSAALSLFVFIGVLSYGLWLGLDIDCGCLPLGVREPLGVAVARDLLMLLACAWLLVRKNECKTVET